MPQSHPQQALGTINWTIALLGGLLSSLSVVNIIVKLYKVGLNPVLADVLAFYSKVITAVTEPILALLPFDAPQWYRDAYVISFVLCTLWLRSLWMVQKIRGEEQPQGASVAFPILFLIISALLSIALFGFLTIVILMPWAKLARMPESRRTYWFTILWAAAGTVLFFAFNQF
jgi:hypothetical protein